MSEPLTFYANVSKMGDKKIVVIPKKFRDKVEPGDQVLVIVNPYQVPLKMIRTVTLRWIGNQTVSIECVDRGEILHWWVSKEVEQALKSIKTPVRADIFIHTLAEIAETLDDVEELRDIATVAKKVLIHCILF
jgi:bifunctional DNA-binding transcriptional regulator/antitoxin component of YhaV-PrlF toxin-antitoxin module